MVDDDSFDDFIDMRLAGYRVLPIGDVHEGGPELGCVWVSCGGSHVLPEPIFILFHVKFHPLHSSSTYNLSVKEAMEIERG